VELFPGTPLLDAMMFLCLLWFIYAGYVNIRLGRSVFITDFFSHSGLLGGIWRWLGIDTLPKDSGSAAVVLGF